MDFLGFLLVLHIQMLLEYVVVFASNDQDTPFQIHSYIRFVVKNAQLLHILSSCLQWVHDFMYMQK